MAGPLFFDDLAVGQRFRSRTIDLGEREMVDFARDNDPQFFHADPQAAQGSDFGGLIGSGWQTAALTMRLVIESMRVAPGVGAVGMEAQVVWKRPVRPGDRLRAETEITKLVASRSNASRGFVSVLTTTFNQSDEVVQTIAATMVLRRSPVGGA